MDKNIYKSFIFLSVLPLIYVSTDFESAFFAGLVLLVISMLIKAASLVVDKYADGMAAIYTYVILTAALISFLSILLNTYFTLNETVGIYLSLLLFSVGLMHQRTVTVSHKGQLIISVAAFGLLVLIGLLREVLGSGSLTIASFGLSTIELFDSAYAISFLRDSSGGFILAGVVLGLVNAINLNKEVKENVI